MVCVDAFQSGLARRYSSGCGGMMAPVSRVDRVQFVENGDLGAAQARQWRWAHRRGLLRRRPGRGTTFRPGKRSIVDAAGPTFPAPSTAFTSRTADASRSSARSRRCITTLLPGDPAMGISSRGMGLPSSVATKPSVPAGPWSRGVTQETRTSPGGRSRVQPVQLRRSGRRLVIFRPQSNGEVRRTRAVLVAAVEEAIGEEAEVEPVALVGELGAGVVEEEEAVRQPRRRGRRSPPDAREWSASRPRRAGMRRHSPRGIPRCPGPRCRGRRWAGHSTRCRSGKRRWRNVAPPGWWA